MADILTKEALESTINDHLTEELDKRRIELTDAVKGTMKEVIEETLKDVGREKKTPWDTGAEDPKGGFVNFADFAKEVYDAGDAFVRPSPRLKAWIDKSGAIEKAVGSPTQSAGSLEAGGALIPPEFARMSLVRARERSSIMGKVMTIPMASNVIDIPYLKDFDNSQDYVSGNVKFRWVSENEGATGSQAKFETIRLELREANALVYVSNRLMDFSPISIEPFITSSVDNALDLALSNAWVNGTGVGQPLGILNSACIISQAKESGQAADTLVYENVLKALARFSERSGEWYASRTVIPQLGIMNISVGAGGSIVPFALGMASSGIGSTGPFGAPIHYEPVMPVLGDAGDIIFCDWSQYLVGQFNGQSGLAMTESAHLKFDYRQHAFQFTFYTDGRPWWPSAFQPRRGDTQSPFVAIAARA